MHARHRTEWLRPTHANVGKLRDCLPAETGAASAEHDDVARARAQPLCGAFDVGEIVGARRQSQQRQRPFGVRLAQRHERALAAAQRIVQRGLRDAVLADRLGPRVLDVLLERHAAHRLRCSRNVPRPQAGKLVRLGEPLRAADHDRQHLGVGPSDAMRFVSSSMIASVSPALSERVAVPPLMMLA